MTNSGDLAREPLARAVLAKLAATRDAEDPLGSMTRMVLRGESTLREAADHPWHGEALDAAFAEAMRAEGKLSAAQREDIERAARALRDSGPEHHAEQRSIP